MQLIRLSVDYEFPSHSWWDKGGRELWEAIAEGGDAASVVVDADLAQSWLEQARSVPGWADGPDYAPHPIAVSSVEEDEEPPV